MFKSEYVHKIGNNVVVLGVPMTTPMFGDLLEGLTGVITVT